MQNHGLRTPGEEFAFTEQPKIHFQIFRQGQSIFCLPHRPKFSLIYAFIGCLQSVCKIMNYWYTVTKFELVIYTTKNTLKYLKIQSVDLPNWPKYLGYFKKNSYWLSVVRARNETTKFVSFSEVFTIHYYTPVKFQAFLQKNILALKYPACRGFSFSHFFVTHNFVSVIKGCRLIECAALKYKIWRNKSEKSYPKLTLKTL